MDMLVAADLSQGVQLVGSDLGDFGGAASVSNLQQALTGLSIASGSTMANPGPVTGSVNPKTVMAISGVLSYLGGKLDGRVKTALQIALPLASQSTTLMAAAKNLISQYADWLTPAVLALTLNYTKSSVSPPLPPVPPSAPTPSAYTTSDFRTAMLKATTAATERAKSGATVPGPTPGTRILLPPGTTHGTDNPLPAGAIQARSKSGMYRIAVPAGLAGQLGGPTLSLGAAFTELPARTSPAKDVRFVSESELEKQTGTQPFYKKPLYLAAVGAGVVVLGGGAWWMTRR